jgi:D-alanyl-D-alanine carboxypeptidase
MFAIIVERIDFGSSVKTADTTKGWQLMVVNRNYRVPENYELEFITLSCGEKVEKRIYPDLQDMFDEALSEGVDLVVRSGYRSEEEQKALMINKINELRNDGLGRNEAKERALRWVSMPGTSEHQLGFAVDINAENGTTDEKAYSWLFENAYKYGFILRYPEDKSDITGISYEPWHFRYVGKKHAKEIYNQGLCLEEYVETL